MLYECFNFCNREARYFCNIFTWISFCLHTSRVLFFLFKPALALAFKLALALAFKPCLSFCYRNLCGHISFPILNHPIMSDQIGVINSIMILCSKIS